MSPALVFWGMRARDGDLEAAVTLEIESSRIPLLPGALDAVRAKAIPRAALSKQPANLLRVRSTWPPKSIPALLQLLYDPQTSGGLLISLSELQAAALESLLPGAHRVGRVLPRDNKPIRLI